MDWTRKRKFSELQQGDFAKGQHVLIEHKDGAEEVGRLVYVRMDHLSDFKHPAAVSVRLPSREHLRGYEGTIFPASEVWELDNRDCAVRAAKGLI